MGFHVFYDHMVHALVPPATRVHSTPEDKLFKATENKCCDERETDYNQKEDKLEDEEEDSRFSFHEAQWNAVEC